MATETIILRPQGIFTVIGQPILTVYPADTPLIDTHLLISEEVPDDDATYIIHPGTDARGVAFYIPEQYIDIEPIEIKVHYRIKPDSGTDTITAQTSCCWCKRTDSVYQYFLYIKAAVFNSNEAEANTLNNEFYIDCIDTLYYDESEYEDEFDGDGNKYIRDSFCVFITQQNLTNASSKATKDARITQIWLEVTYETTSTDEPEEPIIYIKENGSWNIMPCTVYVRSGEQGWEPAPSNLSNFTDGDQYKLVSL